MTMQPEQIGADVARRGLKRRVTIVLALLIVAAIGVSLHIYGTGVPKRGVLVVELMGGLAEAPGGSLLSRIQGDDRLALPTLTLQLDKAAKDTRVEGVLLHIRGLSLGSAQRRELHDAIARLRDSGKKVVALLDFAQIGASAELYVASAASQVYVVPGFLGPFSGLAGEVMLLGGLAEQLGVAVEYERIGAYKSAPESYASRELSPAAREMYTDLFDGLFEDLLGTISAGRGIAPDRLRELIDQAPGTAEGWVEAGLADGIAGREEILEVAGWKDVDELDLGSYFKVEPSTLGLRTGPKIALIIAEGTVIPGEGGSSLFGADRVSTALREVADEDAFEAIVLRINSPGGSALASEQVWRAVRDAREKKPVVVSMGDVAASGGYYVASAADAVVAQPTTQTGSIGVFILRPSLGGLLEKLGVGTELIKRGELAGLAAASQSLSSGQRELLRKLVRASYEQFLDRVAEGRKVPREQVDQAGQGRVWLGSRALELGLVDELGGLDAAFRLAKEKSGIPEDQDPQRVLYPQPKPLAAQIRDLVNGSLRTQALSRLLPGLPASWAGLSELEAGPTLLSPLWVESD